MLYLPIIERYTLKHHGIFVDTTAGIRRQLQTFTGEDTRCVVRTVMRWRYEHRRTNDSQEQEKKCKKNYCRTRYSLTKFKYNTHQHTLIINIFINNNTQAGPGLPAATSCYARKLLPPPRVRWVYILFIQQSFFL